MRTESTTPQQEAPKYVLEGQVQVLTPDDGAALEGVRVFLRQDDVIIDECPTDREGNYTLETSSAQDVHIFFLREFYDKDGNRYDLLTEASRRKEIKADEYEYVAPNAYYVQIIPEVEIPEPDITVSPDTLQVTLEPGETAIQTLTIANEGNADLTWALAEHPVVNWLAETPTDGTLTPSSRQYVKVIFCATGLAVETYETALYITSNDLDEPLQVPVTLTVEIPPPEPEIWVSPSELKVTLEPGATATELLTIGNKGKADLDWKLVCDLGPVWIQAEPTGGTLSAGLSQDVEVTFALTHPPLETLETTLHIHSNDLHQPQVDVPVLLTVEEKPITVSPDTLQVTLEPGKKAIQKLTIANEGDADLTWALAENPAADWLTETPTGGMLPGGHTQDVEVTFVAPTDPATYTTTLQITGKDPDELLAEVSVTLTVSPPIDPKKLIEKLLDSVTQIQTALEKALHVPGLDSDKDFKGKIAAQHTHVSWFLEKQPETPGIPSIKTGIKESSLPAVPIRVRSFIPMAESRATNPPAGSRVRYQDLKAKFEAAMPALSELEYCLEELDKLGGK